MLPPPIAPHDHRVIGPLAFDKRDKIANDIQGRERRHIRRAVAGAITAQIRGHGAESRPGQDRKLVAPGISGLRETVAQQDEGAYALGRDIERDAVDGHSACFKVGHRGSSQEVSSAAIIP